MKLFQEKMKPRMVAVAREHPPSGAAVDPRRLLQLQRHVLEGPYHDPHDDGKGDDEVGEDHACVGVDPAELLEEDEEGHHVAQVRGHARDQDAQGDAPLPVPRDGVRRGQTQRQRQERRPAAHHETVLDVLQELIGDEDLAEVLEGRGEEKERRRGGILDLGLEPTQEHPIEDEDEGDADRHHADIVGRVGKHLTDRPGSAERRQ
jgi:hypothetical protein